MLKIYIPLVMTILLLVPVFSQTQPSVFEFVNLHAGVESGASFPMVESASFFSTGFFAEISGSYKLDIPLRLMTGAEEMTLPLRLIAVAGYETLPLIAGPRIDLGRLDVGAGYTVSMGSRFAVLGKLLAGGFFGAITNLGGYTDISGKPSGGISGAVDVSFRYTGIDKLEIALGARYRSLVGLWSGIEASLAATYRLGKEKTVEKAAPLGPLVVPFNSAGLKVEPVKFKNIFPVFYKYYSNHDIGTSLITNTSPDTLTEISVSFYMAGYMDSPKVCAVIPRLAPGETIPLQIFGLFTAKILEITETTMFSGDLALSYKVNGRVILMNRTEAVRVSDRNAMTWIDDRCITAYITAKDPAVLSFSNSAITAVKDGMNTAVNEKLQIAMALHEALDVYGTKYVVDPMASYASIARNPEVVCFLQYPRQVLEFRAGDCDDLSILFAALLESAGIETAFITVPGQMYVAFSLGMTEEEATSFFRSGDFILKDGKVWLPVDITDRTNGFMAAWQTGVKKWRENLVTKQSFLYPVHDGWTVFEPVELPGDSPSIIFPDSALLVPRYKSAQTKLKEYVISPNIAKLQEEILRTPRSFKLINNLGVLYAKNDLFDKAEAEFAKSLKQGDNFPAFINMGNIFYLKKNLETARVNYERAYRLSPGNPLALQKYAVVNHEMQNYALAKRLYDELKRLDPVLAAKYSYLELKGEEGINAAALVKQKELMVWSE